MVSTPRILVTNDDGYRSDGLKALADALRPLGEVTIVAPVTEASAIGQLSLGTAFHKYDDVL